MAKGKNVVKFLNRKIKTETTVIIFLYVISIIISASLYTIRQVLNQNIPELISEVINEDEFPNSQTGTTYYISANGKSVDGTDIDNPMSLSIANNKTFNGNDKVLFKCGDIFYGRINFNINSIENALFYIGSYGDGEKPIISGANILINREAWILENGLYKIDLSNLNNFEGIKEKNYNVGFILGENKKIYGNRKNSKGSLEKEFDFFCESKYLFLKCDENPSNKLGNIEFVSNINLVMLSSNTILENLHIEMTGAHGISKKNTYIKNVKINNCIIENIGGSVLVENTFTRYGNAIEFWNQAENTLVENCIIRNIYDTGYTVQGNTVTENLGFYKNICKDDLFIKCSWDIEVFCRNRNKTNEICNLKAQEVYNNISINQGRGWGYNTRPDKEQSASYVVWVIQRNNTDMLMQGNLYFNSRRQNYITISASLFKNGIKSNNNTFYLNKNTYLVNNQGSYSDRKILKEYDIEEESTFNLLSDDELEVINNEYIQNLNDYDKIKAYYTFLDGAEYKNKVDLGPIKGYKYNKNGQDVILVYNENGENKIPYTTYMATNIYGNTIENTGTLEIAQEPILILNLDESTLYPNISQEIKTACNEFLQKYNTNLATTNMSKVKAQIENIISEADKLPTYTSAIEKSTVTEMLENTYKQGENIITAFKSNEIAKDYEKTSNMLVDLNNITNKLQKLYSNSTGDDIVFNKQEETVANISNFENTYQYYKDDGISYISQFYNIAKQTQENHTNDIGAYYLSSWSNALLGSYNEDYISKVAVEINYEPKDITNKNVTVTISSNTNIEIASKTYTVENNGTYTYEYKVKGQQFIKSITINNIDKTPPTIAGIENDKVYVTAVTPTIKDEDLKQVELYKDSNKIENYIVNTQINQDGTYKFIAEDKAGNKSQVEFDIYRVSAEIEYSTKDLTNQDVTATITSKANIQVQNNNQNREYTFKENGSFTFAYKIRNQEFSITATVTNIDKMPPTISGIENDTVYQDAVTPIARDENFANCELYKDSNKVDNYVLNTTIAEDGSYKLIAVDKAGNKTEAEFDIYSIPATIEYSTKDLSNQDVIARITSKANIQVQNNNQNKEYTFKDNGNFTFEYKIRNQAFQIEAVVNNIDKEKPQITGVEDKGLYIEEATPQVFDTNLDKVILYLNDEEVKDYKPGTKITGEGIYKIVAIDKAKNETAINFSIMENENKEYQINNQYVVNVSGYTSQKDFDENLQMNVPYEILRNGEKISEEENIATGDILKTSNGQEYTIIVKGDTNKDGKVNIVDVIRLRNYLLSKNGFDNIELKAADCNVDGKNISIVDLIRLRILVLSKTSS